MTTPTKTEKIGPILHLRGHGPHGLQLAAITILPDHLPVPGPITTRTAEIDPKRIASVAGLAVWRHDFTLTEADEGYRHDGQFHRVVTRLTGDMRFAFVSCNGEENGDLTRDPGERNLMWARLAEEHRQRPIAVLLQGGDQIYADEVTKGHPLSETWPEHLPPQADDAQLADLANHLRSNFTSRYMRILGAESCRDLFATVPSLSIWDDHDICDGWGSLPHEMTDSAVGQTLFKVAREMYLLFQHGAVEADIPEIFFDPQGSNLGWCRELPGVTIFAPDLRSERRRKQVMGDAGWRAVRALEPAGDQVFMVSSVPLLGPRLSLLEAVMTWIPKMQHYEDDLRDQWQSHSHRISWRRMLRQILRMRAKAPVTVISGEIHLATRAEMGHGDNLVHQLVASGISHRAPPKSYARILGWFAGLGEAPLPKHPIRIHPLPGHRQRYLAERNFLMLDRCNGRWTAIWHLEESGPTPALALD